MFPNRNVSTQPGHHLLLLSSSSDHFKYSTTDDAFVFLHSDFPLPNHFLSCSEKWGSKQAVREGKKLRISQLDANKKWMLLGGAQSSWFIFFRKRLFLVRVLMDPSHGITGNTSWMTHHSITSLFTQFSVANTPMLEDTGEPIENPHRHREHEKPHIYSNQRLNQVQYWTGKEP